MLAAIALAHAELVGQNEGFAILLERFHIASRRGVDRHGEIAELHRVLRDAGGTGEGGALLSCRTRSTSAGSSCRHAAKAVQWVAARRGNHHVRLDNNAPPSPVP